MFVIFNYKGICYFVNNVWNQFDQFNPSKIKYYVLYFTNISFLEDCGDYQKCVLIHELIPSRFKIRSYMKAVSKYGI